MTTVTSCVQPILVKGDYPEDPRNGGDLRIWNLLRPDQRPVHTIFARRRGTARTPLLWHGEERRIEELSRLRITRFFVSPRLYSALQHRALDAIAAGVRAAVRQWRSNLRPVLVASGHVEALALAYAELPFVFDCCDSMALYFRRRAEQLPRAQIAKRLNGLRMSRAYEAAEVFLARRAAVTVVPSRVDAEYLRKCGAPPAVVAVGNGTDWLDARPVAEYASVERNTIAFHGSMTWEPNRVAALHLARTVMPLVRRAVPDARLLVAGGPVFDDLRLCDGRNGVSVCGYVDDVRAMLRRVAVYAMPMFQGAGFKNKLVEAMALGLPIVTNATGVEALVQAPPPPLSVANGDVGLAQAIVGLLRDPAARAVLGRAARAYAEAEFSWNRCREAFDEALARVPALDGGAASATRG